METQEKKEKKNEKNFIIMILILIALIIIIFLLIRNLGFIEHKPQIPTGNVDIFDIIYQQIGGNTNNTNNNNNNNNNISSTTPKDEQDGVEVYDKATKFSQNTPLNIFTNTTYHIIEDKIAPASENSYQFVIRNHNDFNIKYSLELSEENKYNINMKYRLKLNGVYVSGSDNEWLTYDELNQYDIELPTNNYDVYILDWKWVESENDTQIGTNINSNYKLELKITASEY